MGNLSQTGQKIIELIVEKSGVDVSEVKLESKWDELGLDSLDTVELIMALESEFSLVIPDLEYDRLATVGDAIKYVEEKTK